MPRQRHTRNRRRKANAAVPGRPPAALSKQPCCIVCYNEYSPYPLTCNSWEASMGKVFYKVLHIPMSQTNEGLEDEESNKDDEHDSILSLPFCAQCHSKVSVMFSLYTQLQFVQEQFNRLRNHVAFTIVKTISKNNRNGPMDFIRQQICEQWQTAYIEAQSKDDLGMGMFPSPTTTAEKSNEFFNDPTLKTSTSIPKKTSQLSHDVKYYDNEDLGQYKDKVSDWLLKVEEEFTKASKSVENSTPRVRTGSPNDPIDDAAEEVEKDREREKERERMLEREREMEMELDKAKEKEREMEKEREKVMESSSASKNKKAENSQEPNVHIPVVNGETSKGERAKFVPEVDIPEDCKSMCSETISYVSLEINQSVPVVFCGENFKETTCCLPNQSFGFEFGFGVNEIMESAYSQGSPNDPINDAAEEVIAEVEPRGKEDVELEEAATISLDDVTEGEEEQEEQQALSPESQPSPKSVTEEIRTTPSAEPVQPVSVRHSHSHPPVSHSNRHTYKYSSSHHRNYQFMASNPPMNFFNPSIPPPQFNQMPRLPVMSPRQYIPQLAIPRGISPIQAYGPPVYPPPHLAQPLPPMNMPLAYGDPHLLHLSGLGNPQDPNAHPGYQIGQQIQQPFVLGFGVGMCKLPSGPGPVVEAVAAHAPSHAISVAANKGSESGMSEASIPPPSSSIVWSFEPGVDIAQFFVPLPAIISAVTEREIEQFMEDYIEQLNELCRSGNIKVHRI